MGRPLCSQGLIGVTTSLKKLRVLKYTRVPIRSPDLKKNHVLLCDLRVQSQSQKPPGSNHDLRIYHRISEFLHRLRAPVSVPGSREKTSGSQTKTSWSRGTSGLLDDIRVSRRPTGPHATSWLRDHSPDSNSSYSSSKTSWFVAYLPRSHHSTYGKRGIIDYKVPPRSRNRRKDIFLKKKYAKQEGSNIRSK